MEFQLILKTIVIIGVLIGGYATFKNLDVIKIILIYLKDVILKK